MTDRKHRVDLLYEGWLKRREEKKRQKELEYQAYQDMYSRIRAVELYENPKQRRFNIGIVEKRPQWVNDELVEGGPDPEARFDVSHFCYSTTLQDVILICTQRDLSHRQVLKGQQ